LQTCPSLIVRQSQIIRRTSQCSGVDNITPLEATERSALISTPKFKIKHVSLRDILTSRVLVVILNYAFLALTEMAFTVLLPVYLSTPISNGGLGMSPSLIGVCLAGFGVATGAVSIFLFVPIHRKFGTRGTLCSCESAFIACFALFPVMNKLARDHGGLCPSVWIVFLIQLALATLPRMAFSGSHHSVLALLSCNCIHIIGASFIFLTSAVPSRSALGATTGLAQTTASIMRAIGPAGATSLFALSVEHNLFGGTFVYLVLCLVSAGGTLTATLLPPVPWPKPRE
jgi:hypothetical protein